MDNFTIPLNADAATQKARIAENLWNTRDPEVVSLAYTSDSQWRNRSEFLTGHEAIRSFLKRKWEKEQEYRLIKEVWGFRQNRMAVRFVYEWHDEGLQWFRSFGIELWEFREDGLMQKRHASINDLAISQSERLFHWELGPRPVDHPSLSEMGL